MVALQWWQACMHALPIHDYRQYLHVIDASNPKIKEKKGDLMYLSLNQSMNFGELSMACSLCGVAVCDPFDDLRSLFRMCT